MEFTQNSWATSPGPTFSGDLSIISSRTEFHKMWAQIESQHNRYKTVGVCLNPSSLSKYTDSPSQSMPLSLLCISIACFYLYHSVAFKPFCIVYLFPLLGSLASILCPLKFPLSIKQSLLNIFGYGGHLFCNGMDHQPPEMNLNRWIKITQINGGHAIVI